MYDVHTMERVGPSYDMPLEYCEDFVGFHADDWALELTPKLKKLMEYAKKYQDKQCR
jgi:hypothetical protein